MNAVFVFTPSRCSIVVSILAGTSKRPGFDLGVQTGQIISVVFGSIFEN